LSLSEVPGAFASLPLRYKLLVFASVVVVVELLFRRFAPKSAAYRRWTAFFQGLGAVWTAVLLAVIYLVSVGPVSLFMRLRASDPLDRSLRPEPSFWRTHEPNPLGPLAAARHQF
jgi:Saxitoxin biosynthesis operon protein SxtJ